MRNRPSKITYKPAVRPPAPKPEGPVPDLKYELWQEIRSWVKPLIYVLLFFVFLNSFVIVHASVPTPSMEDTIRTNDRIVAFRLSYLFNEPERYDIVVFGRQETGRLYVKRVLGLPGENLIILDGHVYINGSETPQRYDFVRGRLTGNYGIRNQDTGMLEPFVIPEGYYFVLGDNRSNSYDSRHLPDIYIARGRIVGRAVFRYFPGFANLASN